MVKDGIPLPPPPGSGKEGPYKRPESAVEPTKQDPIPTVTVFAIMYNGEVFEGKMEKGHLSPYNRLEAKYPNYDPRELVDGYMTDDNKFISRAEYDRLARENPLHPDSGVRRVDDHYGE